MQALQTLPPADEAEHDAEVEAVWADAEQAADRSSLPGRVPCPYPDADWRSGTRQPAVAGRFGSEIICRQTARDFGVRD